MFCITIEVPWVLRTCLTTSIKNEDVNLQKLSYLSACKRWTPSLTSFLRYCKDCKLVTLTTLRMLDHAMIVSSCRNSDTQRVEIKLYGTLMFICMQKIIFISKLFFEIFKDIANLLFWELLKCLTTSHQ